MKVAYLAAISRTASTGSPNATRNQVDPKTWDLLQCAAAIFMGDLSAQELYADENSAEIKEMMDTISLDHPGLIGGALRNKALGILWAKQDHSVYQKKMSDLLNDVPMFVPIHFSSHISLSIFDRNVKHFLELIGTLLQNLCARKCLGSVYMSLSYAVRDENDGIKGAT
jgi:hypothetical protein